MKRLPRMLACAALLGGALLGGCKSADEAQVWGVYQEPIEPQPLPPARGESELKWLWSKRLGAGADDGYAILKPAYRGDGMYAASRGGVVYKLNPANGSARWRRDLDAEIFSAVGVDDLRTAVALDDGTVIALDAASGEELWRTPLRQQISAIPAVDSGRVVARTASGQIIGLDAHSGVVAWTLERSVPGLSIHGDSTPVIARDAVFTGLANGRLLANNVTTGREYWETEVSFASGRNELERITDSDTAPLIAADTVYTATYQGNVVALQRQNSAVKWKAKVSSRLPMSLADGKLLVTDELGAVIAIDAANGAILWTQEAFRGRGMSRPLAHNGRVVVGDASGDIHSLDLSSGTLLETRKAVSGAVVGLIPGPDQFAVFSSTGNLSVWTLPRDAAN
ncbi:MAG: outer membrane protein assembly factor BamB [bacterium]